MKALFLITSLFFTFTSFAETCSPVNLVTAKDSPFQNIPVYDQDGIGACYAYSAAQLADYYLQKNKKTTTRNVHPAWVALKYTSAKRQKNLSGGSVVAALNSIRTSGNCDYAKVSESLSKYAKLAKVNESQMLDILEKFSIAAANDYSANHFNRGINNDQFGQDIFGKPVNKSLRQYNYQDAKRLLDKALKNYKQASCTANKDYDALVSALAPLIDFSANQMVTSILFPSCLGLKQNEIPAAKNTSFKSEDDVTKNLIYQLSKYKAPSGISYCATIWSNPEYPGVVQRPFKTAKDCGNHASIVVGMKPVNNQCHFLIRNTWGSGFSKYTANWKCLCKHKKTGAYVDDCTNKTHNNGQYKVEGCWIESDKLKKNVYQTTTLN